MYFFFLPKSTFFNLEVYLHSMEHYVRALNQILIYFKRQNLFLCTVICFTVFFRFVISHSVFAKQNVIV